VADPNYSASYTEALADQLRRRASLDRPKDESLTELGGEMALGVLPGIGQGMAIRDFERSRREGDKTGMALSAASLLPFGRLFKSGKDIVRRIHSSTKSPEAAAQVKALRKKYKDLPEETQKDLIYRDTGKLILPRMGGTDDIHKTWQIGDVDPTRIVTSTAERPVLLGDIADLSSIEVPKIRNIVARTKLFEDPAMHAQASYNPQSHTARFRPEVLTGDPMKFRRTLGHEVQHGIDYMRGSPSYGTSPDFEKEKLERLAWILQNRSGQDIAGIASDRLGGRPEAWDIALKRYRQPNYEYGAYRRNMGEIGARMAEDIEELGREASPFALRKMEKLPINVRKGDWQKRILDPEMPMQSQDMDRLISTLIEITN
jgi:hypothetical protein